MSQVPREAIVVSTSSTKHYGVEVSSEINDVLDKGRPVRTERDGTIRVLTVGVNPKLFFKVDHTVFVADWP